MSRAYHAGFWLKIAALSSMVLAGLVHSAMSHHRLPGLRENGLQAFNELMEEAEPSELLAELRMASQFGTDAGMTMRLVEAAQEAKDLDNTIWGVRHLIELGAATDARTYNQLAALLLKRDRALESLLKRTSLPDLAGAREALRWAGEAARIEPSNAESRLHQGIASASLGEREQAVAHLKEALQLDPDLRIAGQVLQVVSTDAGSR